MQPTPNSAGKIVVLVSVLVIVGAFAVILWRSIASMGGYDFAFDSNKKATEAMRRHAEQQATLEANESAGEIDVSDSVDGGRSWSLRTTDASGARDGLPEQDVSRVVVLIHGLNDPGWTWQDLIAALVDQGHVVVRFEYPNDHAIARSADRFAEALEFMGESGIDRIAIVAHSMGGLIARDALTRPGLYGEGGAADHRLPAVERVIMLGTPNHGSEFARLWGLGEIGEQISRAWQGNARIFEFLEEGAGEASRDLLPGSPYLRELNARPRLCDTPLTIIAGRVSPIDSGRATAWIGAVDSMVDRERLPAWLRERAEALDQGALRETIDGLLDGLGDGVVSIESARLGGVEDVQIVEADHLGMIVDFLHTGRTPPAIPIILDRLRESDID